MDKVMIGVLAALALVIGSLIGATVYSSVQWKVYAKKHGCVEVARKSNPAIFVLQPIIIGNTTHLQPTWLPQSDTVTYKCDNGTVVR